MKKRTYSLLLVLLFLLWSPVAAQGSPSVASKSVQVIDPALQIRLNSQAPNDKVRAIAILSNQVDLLTITGRSRSERLRNLIQALQAKAFGSQVGLLNLLNARKATGEVSTFTPLWIQNAVALTATPAVITEVASFPGVAHVIPDTAIPAPTQSSSSEPEPNISLINAPALWSLGFRGQGVVVASMDTGVSSSHPDLSGQWRGGTNSWYDPYGEHPTTPTDINGHGTWTTGVIVGRDAGGSSIGVAPDARWIAVKIFNDGGVAYASAIHQGYQWLLNPDNNLATLDAPNVVNNSWSFGSPGCNLEFEPDLQALVVGGITPVFAAGNYGPGNSTGASPANNPAAFPVGAVDNSDLIYNLSSRGPNNCGVSESVMYPAVVVPGVNVRTTDLYGLYTTATGTSLAAPHGSGALALLLSAFPNLSVADLRTALTNSAVDLGPAGADNDFGSGRIDVLAAYNLVASGALPTATPTLTPAITSTPSPTATPTATPTSALATTLHIGDLDRSSIPSGTKWNGTVTILVHDNYDRPVAGATVYGKWTNGATGNVSCVTNSNGICSITKTSIKSSTASITFTATNITRTGLTYQSSANHDPDGDSNGTVIIVLKP